MNFLLILFNIIYTYLSVRISGDIQREISKENCKTNKIYKYKIPPFPSSCFVEIKNSRGSSYCPLPLFFPFFLCYPANKGNIRTHHASVNDTEHGYRCECVRRDATFQPEHHLTCGTVRREAREAVAENLILPELLPPARLKGC